MLYDSCCTDQNGFLDLLSPSLYFKPSGTILWLSKIAPGDFVAALRLGYVFLTANDWYRETTANLCGKAIGNFRMARHGFDSAGLRICPQ